MSYKDEMRNLVSGYSAADWLGLWLQYNDLSEKPEDWMYRAEELSIDNEDAHMCADAALCALLTELGFDDFVERYDKIGKWYA